MLILNMILYSNVQSKLHKLYYLYKKIAAKKDVGRPDEYRRDKLAPRASLHMGRLLLFHVRGYLRTVDALDGGTFI